MVATPDTYVGVVGFQIFVDAGQDITGAASVNLLYRKPDNTEGEFVGNATTKGALDGAEYVTTAVGDLDQAGTWHIELEINGLAGFTGPSSIATILVGRPLPGA